MNLRVLQRCPPTPTTVPVTVSPRAAPATGRPVLLLHGGAGPDSVAGFGDALAGRSRSGC